ncbi:dihydrofolate reductase family protein [Shewanella schlegeliana]|uniref:Dihydrofolate reductase n=1 Tax=Shewanella schlegeliana TaxID=190308 RepID=A0ABS1T0U9_9GAMM|nr:dihydrofolate reductase family protein [Shewanella schlegeliana]MBL4914408.1 dihydrofolate reductase [Shewanella schlegeliana]MCL1109368.1 dihydrofolate reductase family protein [Shewanella schlegeliana]GIU31781.1 diacylglycerol kinase [Shewanella schlegeliana]
MPNIVYIATSLDGFIADKDNKVDWLHDIPNPEGSDLGFSDFMTRIDALVMGRNTLGVVLSFGIDWPYTKPVFVLSNTLTRVPEGLEGKVFLVKGPLKEVLKQINAQGYHELYIDGGKTIQSFLQEDLIDELIITTIPVLLGGGISLFGELASPLKFKHVKAERLVDYLVQNRFIRQR